MTIHLPEDLEQFVQMKVRSGCFASADEVIGEAVRLLRQHEEAKLLTEIEMQRQPTVGGQSTNPAWRRVLDIMGELPDEAFDRMPSDSSAQLDHYLYATPKRPVP